MSLATWVDMPARGDDRGSLVAIEVGQGAPFEVKRVYYIFGTKPGVSRGYHAHLNLKQLAVCVAGSCTLRLDDGFLREDYLLDSPDRGVLIDSFIWREMHDFSQDCVLLVVASEHYDESDYIRDYQQFLSMVKADYDR